MKPVKKFVLVAMLLSVLAVNTPAGEQQTPGYTSPPPPPAPEHMTISTEGDLSLDDSYYEQSGETTETSDYLLFEAFAALLSVY